jgi:hypothetical protein
MTIEDDLENQPILFMDESRLTRVEGISAEGGEALADLFIVSRRGMTKGGAISKVLQAEFERFIELLFRESEAHRLALKLYARRYEVTARKDAADILRQAIAEQISGDN